MMTEEKVSKGLAEIASKIAGELQECSEESLERWQNNPIRKKWEEEEAKLIKKVEELGLI